MGAPLLIWYILGGALLAVSLLLGTCMLTGGLGGGKGANSRQRRRRHSSLGGEGGELPTGTANTNGGGGIMEPEAGANGGMNDPRYNGLKLVDWNGSPLPFNEIIPFENEFFEGRVLFLLKTDPEDPVYGSYFHGKQRLFEMQIQGQFKKLPDGVLYMGAELGERMQLGLVTKTVANMVLTFAKRLIKNLHYSLGESLKGVSNADEIEMPHVTFPLSRGMDRLIITPPGERPPAIGEDIKEPDEIRIARRAGRGEEPQFMMGHTYTMSFHSMYIDFVNWQMVNVAGQKSIDLANYFGDSSVHIVVYDLEPSAAASGKHRKSDKRYFYQVELINSGLTQDDPDRVVEGAADKEELGKEDEDEEGLGGDDVFLRSGDVVPLLASTGGVILAGDNSTTGATASSSSKAPNGAQAAGAAGLGEAGWGCVTESKGFCLVRPGTNPTEVHVIKVGGASAYYRSDYLCNGDVVILRNAQNLKYLSVYKGWWLFWTPAAPSSSSSRAHFVIHGLDEAERLTLGRPFTLRSSKWSTYEIGISQHASSEYGGRLLGLYQTSKTKKMFQSKKSKSWLLPVQLKCLRAPPDDQALGAGGAAVAAGLEGDRTTGGVSPTRPGDKDEEDKMMMETLDPFVAEEDGSGGGSGISPEDVEEGLEVDVPAWIEMGHRRRKKAQLAYVLRVRFRSRSDVRWMALRTGSDLAPVIQMKRDRHADGAGLGKDDLPKTSAQYNLQRAGTKAGGAARQQATSTLHSSNNGFRPLQHQSPADQSARLLCQTLLDMCSPQAPSTPNASTHGGKGAAGGADRPAPPSCKAALYSLLKRRNFLDVWFLGGAAADLGVSVLTRPVPPVLQSVVARALWETHWREEWAALYPTHVSFYTSGAKKPTWSIFLHEILLVRPMDDKRQLLPFPGKAFLALEALGRVHYLCFPNEAIRDIWTTQISSRLGQPVLELPAGLALSDPREAFVLKSGQWRPSNRLILNARRMGFDVSPPQGNGSSSSSSSSLSQVSERALRLVYDLSPDSGPERLVAFLDQCSMFKAIPLAAALDVASDEAVAFFLNIYHTLVQHALLLLGPPSSKDWASFFSSVSYEIGPDVFSLTEIEHCVIRGKLSRPRTLPRHMPSPPSPHDDHYQYALSRVDYRVNFALINGSISSPPFVTIFRADNLDEQLNNAAVRFIDYTLKLGESSKRRTILLPKVCDSFRADFDPSESSSKVVVNVCLRYLDRDKWERVSWTLAGAKPPTIKYMSFKLKTHESLHLIEDRQAQAQQQQPSSSS